MAQNFQPQMVMGGNGQMMPQQRQQQQQQQQQRPPQTQQMQQMIYHALDNNPMVFDGWQSQVLIGERINLIFNIIANLRLASQGGQGGVPPLQKLVEIGLRFEREIFEKSPNKDQYKHDVDLKVQQLTERRQQNAAGLQQQITMQAQQQAQQQAHAQQMMMNQNGMQGQVPRNIPQQTPQHGYQHLQHQMQASQIPGQHQLSMGMPNEGLPPNMVQNQQQQFQMLQQAQQQAQLQNASGRPQTHQLQPQETQVIHDLTNRLMAQASNEEKEQMRMKVQSQVDPVQLANYRLKNIDPMILGFRQQALQKYRQSRQANMAQVQAQAQAQFNISQQQHQQPPQNIPATAPPMQQQRSMNPSPMNGQLQPPTSNGGNQDFGFIPGNMGTIVDQQQQGVIAQEAGQMVVPANSGQRNSTPQPGVINGQQINPNVRAHQQQMLNAQQAQQQRMQHAQQAQQAQQQQQQQQQAQQNARTQASKSQAQHMALQGQPGGMGPGPVPPQQSPAMATLNAPLRTPSQQMNQPEPPQANPNAQFGQPLDPRFIQQRGAGNAMHQAMMAAMPLEQQQRLASLPPEKLQDVVNRWHEQRAQQINGGNPQVSRPQMPMQGNNMNMRNGQQSIVGGQLNPQQMALRQFMMANPGQQPPPNLINGMTPQQQMLMRQQVAAMRQPQNPLQQGNAQPNAMPIQQQQMLQMDATDFPPNILSYPMMPRNIPQDLKKWGNLKNWSQNTPSVSPQQVEAIKHLQKLHFQQILRGRQQQQQQQQQQGQPQPVIPVPNIQGAPQMGAPGMPAPIAPMVNANGIQMQPGMNMGLRQPTQQDIQNARQLPQMANLSDDEVRNGLMRRQLNAQQQQQQQQRLMAMQLANQNQQLGGQQLGGQQPRPTGQQPGNILAAVNIPPQVAQVKQPQAAPDSAVAAPTPANRASKPISTGRAAQNSSPAQPAKNLKRASSDDVVEIPHPNIQPPRTALQQTHVQKPPPQQTRPALTSEQVARLDPEARKKYEHALRMFQQSQQGQNPDANEAAMQLKTIMMEEGRFASNEVLPDISMDREAYALMSTLLRNIVVPLVNVGKAVPRWYLAVRDDKRCRMFFRTQHRIRRQFQDPGFTKLRDAFSMQAREVEQFRGTLQSMVQDLSEKFPHNRLKSQGAPPEPSAERVGAPPPPTSTTQAGSAPIAPLNAANLHQQQQQLKMHQKTASRGSHTPAAPTSSQPPMPNWGASSPHGTPAYIGKAPVTQENLHIPARKKQKANTTSTPGGLGTPASNASPQVTKPVSPELKRQQFVDSKPIPKPSLCCPEPNCDRHNVGFDSQEALEHHTQEEHIKPTANPLKYAQDNLAACLGLDSEGRPKVAGGENMAVADSKQSGRTPNIKAGTPMSRQDSMVRQGSTTDSKANIKSEPGKLQATQSSQGTAVADLWANSTVDPQELFSIFGGFDSGAGGAISDLNMYRSITPNESPESDQTAITDTSDISDGVNLDINLDISFDETLMLFGASDADGLGGMGDFNFGDEDMIIPTIENDQPMMNFQSWDDNNQDFTKPFEMDTSYFSMSVE